MSKIRKRDFKKRNWTARQEINQRADVFRDRKHEPKGGKHGQRVELQREIEETKVQTCIEDTSDAVDI